MISKNSKNIAKIHEKENQIPLYLDIENFIEKQKKKEEFKQIAENEKMKEVTGKPKISNRARSLNRDVNDLYTW